jgi:hypothetical protein
MSYHNSFASLVEARQKMLTGEKDFSLDSFLKEDFNGEGTDLLLEKLITFGKTAYPKFGHILIMAGGGGSGKGFIKDKLIGMEGFNFDVDELKRLAAITPAIVKKVKDELGVDIKSLYSDMKNPDNVSRLHYIVADFLRLDSGKQKTLFSSILTANPERKPNIIFDVTLKDFRKLQTITDAAKMLGYDPKNIHLVWVVQDIEVAKKLNQERDRTVPVEILINTHRGASQTMHDIIEMGENLKKYLDGRVFIAFNKVGVDSQIQKSEIEPTAHSQGFKPIGKKGPQKGFYIVDANYIMIKDVGKAPLPLDKISADVKRKIADYVPKNVEWV